MSGNLDEGEFARQLARTRGRIALHSVSLHAMTGHSVSLPEDGSVADWVEILPLGTFSGKDGRGPFTADGEKILQATKAKGLDRLAIDYDHRTYKADDSRAAGWIRALKIAAGKMLARVEWTPAARAAIAKREYRFISPVFKFQPDDPDAPETVQSGAVLYLDGAALTNDPNLDMAALA
jgi:phage I-like protein